MGVTRSDLKTISKMITTQCTALGLGQVPSTNKRWITFIRIDNRYGGLQTVYLCSTTLSNSLQLTNITGRLYAASAAAKDRFQLSNEGNLIYPESGPTDVDRPLFSIANSKYLTTMTSRGPANLFIQYFDEARN